MPRYSEEIIEEVRSRNDIVDVIGGYISLKHKGNSYSACCPFHHEKTPSFHVNREKQMYHCFGCGAGGNVYTFIMEYENYSFPEAVKLLADRSGFSLPEQEMSEEQKRKENYKVMLKEMNKSAAAYFHFLLTKTEHGKKAMAYLLERGITEETVRSFGLGYSDIYKNDLYQYLKGKGYTDAQMKGSGLIRLEEGKGAIDRFWNRVMIPILDINGKVIAFGGRVMGEGLPKYINTEETAVFDKSHNLFALNLARRSKRRGFILCEGYMDVISMHQAGFDNAVASLGTAFTIGQAGLIKRYSDEVYLAYDSDAAGAKATLKAISILREVGITGRVIDMKPHKDPDEFIRALGKEAYEERIRNAVTGIMYEVATMAGSFNLKDPEEKIRFTKDIARRLSAISEPVVRHSYMDTICEQYSIERDSFKEMVTRYGTMQLNEKIGDDAVRVERRNSNDKELDKSQSLLLTWMVNDTSLFRVLDGIVSEEDFSDEECLAVARVLYEQYKKTGGVNPAAIVDMSDDADKQRLVAKMLQTELPFEVDLDERERALNDVVRRVKLDRIDRELYESAEDMLRFQQLIVEKSKLNKLHISLRS